MAPSILNEGEIFGSGLAEAYEIESKFAEYPRVVIGPKIFGYLKRAAGETENPDIGLRAMAWLASKCLSLVSIDSDGRVILDYFGEGVAQFIGSEKMKERWKAALQFAENQEIEHGRAGIGKLVSRYYRLKMYLLEREHVVDSVTGES